MSTRAKDISEIAKNWGTAITLVAGLLLTITQATSLVNEKEKEIQARTKNLKSDYAKARIAIFKETEKELPKLIKAYESEMALGDKSDDAKLEHIVKSIEDLREQQLKTLIEIKNYIEAQSE